MHFRRVSFFVVCVLGVTMGRPVDGGQGGRGNAAADIPILPYGSWSGRRCRTALRASLPVRGISFRWHRWRSRHEAASWCSIAARTRLSSSRALGRWSVVGRRDVQRGKGRGHSRGALDRRQVALFGRLWAGRMHVVWRPLGACGSTRKHLADRRARPRRLQDGPGWEGDHAPRHEGRLRDGRQQLQSADRRRVRPKRRYLRQRRLRQRPSGEVLTRREIPVAMGQARKGSRRVRTAPQPGGRRTGQGVRHRLGQPANPGV